MEITTNFQNFFACKMASQSEKTIKGRAQKNRLKKNLAEILSFQQKFDENDVLNSGKLIIDQMLASLYFVICTYIIMWIQIRGSYDVNFYDSSFPYWLSLCIQKCAIIINNNNNKIT